MEWYLKVVRDNYANFNGRARRKEFWMFTLFNFIISSILAIIDQVMGLTYGIENQIGMENGILQSIYGLAVFIPSLAVAVRRLQDTSKSGWNLLWVFTCIGIFYILYLYIVEGDHGQNKYGPDPKEDENQDPFAGQRQAFQDPNNPYNTNPPTPNNPFDGNRPI
ncbi:DUF805 domain-containing protein [Sphingobacterium alkalisoli]|uniref:DUF805 domain-containing protein n=1 Tax=Sphingobacterium alkalisoli TaxID=1874115 RepID=A0A4U0H7R3_9SPHI|nr:DUF805 domain-containing protein [Sphingobacterium alkalisoli]TJY67758.1 DUF805 domain-containing protein [Sphingobacterium alkalisoli]GGH11558.1 aminopeptidase [Sphingobacterium alkalisoli]